MAHTFVILLLTTVLAQPGADSRPRDPWVIRGVLDQQPRMITLALDEDLWVAYDTKTCTFYKAWTGDVDYTGAVYDTLHGPQPTIQGSVWLEHPAIRQPWKINWHELSGQVTSMTTTPKWKGYRFVDGQVQLMYEMRGRDGSTILVTEIPDVSRPNELDGELAFTRTFHVEGLPNASAVIIPIPRESPMEEVSVRSNGRIVNMRNSKILMLESGPSVEVITHAKPPAEEASPPEEVEEEIPFYLAP